MVAATPPFADDVEDSLGWRWDSKRIFTIPSSYKVIALTISIADDGWKCAWKLQCPQQVRSFMRLVLNKRVLTN